MSTWTSRIAWKNEPFHISAAHSMGHSFSVEQHGAGSQGRVSQPPWWWWWQSQWVSQHSLIILLSIPADLLPPRDGAGPDPETATRTDSHNDL